MYNNRLLAIVYNLCLYYRKYFLGSSSSVAVKLYTPHNLQSIIAIIIKLVCSLFTQKTVNRMPPNSGFMKNGTRKERKAEGTGR